jgi:putative hydrolase of HD superfamily
MSNAAALLRFFTLALRLKQVRRQGWIDRGVRAPESSADHSWGVALLAWILAAERPELNRERVLLLALIHDLPEALAGDMTPFDTERAADGTLDAAHFMAEPTYSAAAAHEKETRETAALETLLAGLHASLALEIRSAWEEYGAAATPEARFVKQLDKLETMLQAELYAVEQPELVIESFRRGTRRDVTDEELRQLLEAQFRSDEE